MPLQRRERGHSAHDEQVEGVGEETDTARDDGTTVKLREWRLVEDGTNAERT
jgi:hypothetical protein